MMDKWHVFEYMTRNPYVASPDTGLRELTAELVRRRATAAPVLNQSNEIVGMVSFADVAVDGLLHPNMDERTVRDIMQLRVHTIEHSATIVSAARMLQQFRIQQLVVTQGKRLAGMLSAIDLMEAIAAKAGYKVM